ncbi:hypothetical protein AB0L74_31885 [Streptomyces sp. NPDC052020]|uniref:hypothetical protein n=1 Tax=Streptomyces sp. NPDC052020 TaxID=3155677 RepID=UPI003448EE86
MPTCTQDDLPSLHTLAAGIDRDIDAVTAGLTLPWNSGVVEGHVNRIKMLERAKCSAAPDSTSCASVSCSHDEACDLAPQEQLHRLLIQVDLGGPATQ